VGSDEARDQGDEAADAGRGVKRSSQANRTSAVCTLQRCQPCVWPTSITARLPCASQNSFARAIPRDLMSASDGEPPPASALTR